MMKKLSKKNGEKNGEECKFIKQLKKAAEEIKKEANGKKCSDCIYFSGQCYIHNIIHSTPEAVACRYWESRK